MTLVNFQLERLSDGMLLMMLKTTLNEQKQQTIAPLHRAVQSALADEKLRRAALRAGEEPSTPVRMILPFMDRAEIVSAQARLLTETVDFETAALAAESKDPALCSEYRTAAEFCYECGLALLEMWRGLTLAQSGVPN